MTKTSTFGPEFIPKRDGKRLKTQRGAIRDFMLEQPLLMTLGNIVIGLAAKHPGHRFPGPSISAQIRHLTRPEHGGYVKTKDYIGNGLYVYGLRERVRTQHQAQLFAGAVT